MQTQDKTKQAFERIEQGVKDIYSSDNFKQYLSMLKKFHNYSLNNTLLILQQKPNASYVAGYNSWRDNFKRQVNKGEKAIQILAPYQIKVSKEIEDEKEENETQEKSITRFRLVNVFDISQTDGQPLPSLVSDLKGTTNEVKALIKAVETVCPISINWISEKDDITLQSGAKGYYSKITDSITVNNDLEDLQKAKTLIHEFVHSILHKQSDKPPFQKEIEAESLAYVICDYFGIDTQDYSFGYIASYASEDTTLMKIILKDIQSNAHEMIEKIEPVFRYELSLLNNDIELNESIAHDNYLALLKLATPILTGDATYIKYKAIGMEDLVIEKIGDDRIAMAHYYELNGDLMADPDVEIIIDNFNELLIPQTYQQDNLAFYETVKDNPNLSNELNGFMKDWLNNINNSHYKICTLYTDNNSYSVKENNAELIKYCKHNGIGHMVNKIKELER